jgi:lysozyme family protein
MAKFIDAFNRTMTSEGIYSDHPDDPGGETYMGISRVYHPNWPGWSIIDRGNKTPAGPSFDNLVNVERLQEHVQEFYRKAFWKPLRGDDLPDQDVANKLFNMAVNIGIRNAAKYLQTALNTLNRGGELWEDTAVDGYPGPHTVVCTRACNNTKRDKYLIAFLIGLQVGHYMELFDRNPKLESFAAGWAVRAFEGLDRLLRDGFQ